MERLTYIDNEGWYVNGENGKRLRGPHIDRLAAYEGTELEPEEIDELLSMNEVSPEAEYTINRYADSLIEKMDALLHRNEGELSAYRLIGSVSHLKELVQAKNDGRLVVLPEVSERERKNFADGLHDYFEEAKNDDPSVGLFGMSEGERVLADAIMKALVHEEAEAALTEKEKNT